VVSTKNDLLYCNSEDVDVMREITRPFSPMVENIRIYFQFMSFYENILKFPHSMLENDRKNIGVFCIRFRPGIFSASAILELIHCRYT
jgi:hypothetical protein